MHGGARGESENLVFHLVWTGVWPSANEQQVHWLDERHRRGAGWTVGPSYRPRPTRRHLFVILYGGGVPGLRFAGRGSRPEHPPWPLPFPGPFQEVRCGACNSDDHHQNWVIPDAELAARHKAPKRHLAARCTGPVSYCTRLVRQVVGRREEI